MPQFEAKLWTGIAEPTFYSWKKKFAAMEVSKIRRLKQLEEENKKLKQLVADLSLDKTLLQDVIKKSGKARQAPRRRPASARSL